MGYLIKRLAEIRLGNVKVVKRIHRLQQTFYKLGSNEAKRILQPYITKNPVYEDLF